MLSLIRREDDRMTPRIPTGDIADFDFFIGSWTVAHRRLKRRLVGSDEWDAFPGTSRCEKRLGGLVNVDEDVFPTKGFAGMTMRVFDPAQRRWSFFLVERRIGAFAPTVHGGIPHEYGPLLLAAPLYALQYTV